MREGPIFNFFQTTEFCTRTAHEGRPRAAPPPGPPGRTAVGSNFTSIPTTPPTQNYFQKKQNPVGNLTLRTVFDKFLRCYMDIAGKKPNFSGTLPLP